jgi:hypoxanthine phosphoribosyltransferase
LTFARFSTILDFEKELLMSRTPQKERLFSSRQIQKRVGEMARTLSRDYRGRDLVLVGVLNGAFIFLADLVKRMTIPVQIDFVRLSSYGNGSESRGRITVSKPTELPLTGKSVLIVEDIIDTGLTLDFLCRSLKEQHPESIRICALVDKNERRKLPVSIDYVGFVVPSGFIVGYGLDFNERFRQLPAIYRLASV